MRLTNIIRNAFIRSVMRDVPKTDYQAQAEKIVYATLDELFHEQISGELDRETAGKSEWISRVSIHLPKPLVNSYTYGPSYDCIRDKKPEAWAKLEALAKKVNEQSMSMSRLESQIRGVAYSVNTRKALVAALPEFEKYLPEDEVKAVRTLPVVANVVADFVKAGWPAKKEAVAA